MPATFTPYIPFHEMDDMHGPTSSLSGVDETAKEELELYIENTRELYEQKKSIIANIKRRIKNGTYDPALAPKLWMYWVDAGAKRYVREFGSAGDKVSAMFNKATREALAKDLAEHYFQLIQQGEYN